MTAADIDSCFTATPGQRRLWEMIHSYSSPEINNLLHCYRVFGRIKVATFEDIFQKLSRKYPIFRVSFEQRHDRLLMRIGNPDFQFHFHKTSSEHLQRQFIHKIAGTQFSFTDASLLRFYLLQVNSAEHLLIILTHHLVSDGMSGRILEDDLFCAHDDPERWHSTQGQDSGFFRWCETVKGLSKSNSLLTYWQTKLSGKKLVMHLPSLNCDNLAPSFKCQRRAILLETSLLTQVQAFCVKQRVTLFSLCAAIFNWNLAAWCNTRWSAVQIQVSGRHKSDYDSAIGFFANYAFLTSEFAGNTSFTDYLAELWNDILDVYAYQAAPHELVVRNLRRDYRTLRSVLYWFDSFSSGTSDRVQHGVRFRALSQPTRTVCFYELMLACLPTKESMSISAIFNEQKFHATHIHNFLDRILRSFALLTEEPHTTFDSWLSRTNVYDPL